MLLPSPLKSPEGPRNSSTTEATGSETISRSSGRFLYSRRTAVNVESSGSPATSAQMTTAAASESTFQPRSANTRLPAHLIARITADPHDRADYGHGRPPAEYRLRIRRSAARPACGCQSDD